MKISYPLILASTSKYRSKLLSELGIPFTSESPEVDEGTLKSKGLSPYELARILSVAKAQAVFGKHPDSCVIGSDQVCCLGEEIFSKPGSVENAQRQLEKMQGKIHKLLTAVTVISPSGRYTFVDETTLHMRGLSSEEISDYIQKDMPLACAGSYMIETVHGSKLFDRIETQDKSAIIGLPLIELKKILAQFELH